MSESYQYYKPFYLGSMTPVYPLSGSGDYSTVFYEAKYRILHDRFVSRTEGGTVFPPLEVLYDYRGRSILPPGIDRKKFRLLSESRQFDKFYDTVTELYGFTPTKTFTTSVITSWTRPAFKCELDTVVSRALTDWVVNEDGTTDIACDNSDGRISVDSVVNLASGEYEGSDSKTLTQRAENVPVIAVSAVGFKVGVFNWTIYNLGGEQQGTVESSAEGSAFKIDDVAITAEIAGGISRTMSLRQTDSQNETHVVNVDNADGRFKDGDVVYFYKAFLQYGTQQSYEQVSDYVTILKAYDDRVIVPFFTWYVGSSGHATNSNDSNGGFYAPGAKTIIFRGEERISWAADFAGTQVVDFVAEFDPQNAWAPESGREIVDFLAYYTTPTLQEYKEMISRGDMVLAQPQTYELVAGNVYKRTSVYVKCQ